MKTATAALLFLYASFAAAQSAGGTDFESGQGAEGLVLLVCAGIAFFFIKNEFKCSAEEGVQAMVICAGVAMAALFFPPVRIVLALLTVGFFVYGFLHRS